MIKARSFAVRRRHALSSPSSSQIFDESSSWYIPPPGDHRESLFARGGLCSEGEEIESLERVDLDELPPSDVVSPPLPLLSSPSLPPFQHLQPANNKLMVALELTLPWDPVRICDLGELEGRSRRRRREVGSESFLVLERESRAGHCA